MRPPIIHRAPADKRLPLSRERASLRVAMVLMGIGFGLLLAVAVSKVVW